METGNLWKKEVVAGGNLQNAPETLELRDYQDSKGGILDKMPDGRERKLKDPPPPIRKTGYQVRDVVAITQTYL
jgi:hypothetical protein